MRTDKPNNPSAFPLDANACLEEYKGMTLRDYFAAKALQGLLSNTEWMIIYKGEKYIRQSNIISEVSYGMADAMLKQREL